MALLLMVSTACGDDKRPGVSPLDGGILDTDAIILDGSDEPGPLSLVPCEVIRSSETLQTYLSPGAPPASFLAGSVISETETVPTVDSIFWAPRDQGSVVVKQPFDASSETIDEEIITKNGNTVTNAQSLGAATNESSTLVAFVASNSNVPTAHTQLNTGTSWGTHIKIFNTSERASDISVAWVGNGYYAAAWAQQVSIESEKKLYYARISATTGLAAETPQVVSLEEGARVSSLLLAQGPARPALVYTTLETVGEVSTTSLWIRLIGSNGNLLSARQIPTQAAITGKLAAARVSSQQVLVAWAELVGQGLPKLFVHQILDDDDDISTTAAKLWTVGPLHGHSPAFGNLPGGFVLMAYQTDNEGTDYIVYQILFPYGAAFNVPETLAVVDPLQGSVSVGASDDASIASIAWLESLEVGEQLRTVLLSCAD